MGHLANRVAKNSIAIYSGRIVNLGITFFAFVHLANYLGEGDFGRLSLAIAYIGTFEIIVNFGLNQVIVREISSTGKDRISTLLGNGIILKFILASSAILVAFALSPFLSYPKETLTLIYIISLNLILTTKLSSARTIFDAIFQARLKMIFPILYGLFDAIVFAALLYVFTINYNSDLITIAWIYTLSNLPGALLLLISFLKETNASVKFNFKLIQPLFFECLPIAFYLLFSILNTKIDVLLLSWIRSESEVGYYSAATRLVYPLVFFSTSFSISLFPLLSRFYEQDMNQFLRVARTGAKFITLLAIYLSVVLAFNAKNIILKFYIPSFASAIEPFKFLIVALGFNFLNLFFVDIIVAMRRQKMASFILAIALLTNIGLNLILVPDHGIVGASYARLASTLVGCILFILVITKKLSIKKLLPTLKILLFAVVFLLINIFTQKLEFMLNIIVNTTSFITMLVIFRIVTNEEFQRIHSMLRSKKQIKLEL